MRRMMGEDVEPVARPETGDNRFKDPDWSSNPYFDYWKQVYLLTSRWAEDMLERTDGLGRGGTPEGAVPPAPGDQRTGPLELPDDQPGSHARDNLLERAKSRRGHDQSRPGHGKVGRSSEDLADRQRSLRSRPQSCCYSWQGHLSERSHPAPPVRAVDRTGLPHTTADRAAVDQQVLHPGPHPTEVIHQVCRGAGLHGIRHLLGQSR